MFFKVMCTLVTTWLVIAKIIISSYRTIVSSIKSCAKHFSLNFTGHFQWWYFLHLVIARPGFALHWFLSSVSRWKHYHWRLPKYLAQIFRELTMTYYPKIINWHFRAKIDQSTIVFENIQCYYYYLSWLCYVI